VIPFLIERPGARLVARLGNVEGDWAEVTLAERRLAQSPEPLRALDLTPRESEVLFWVARGKTNSEIALILQCALGTVSKHLEHIYSKIGVETRTAAAAIALEILD
jgi:DNA-binding CsgD family transcriptional regulator